MRKMIKTILNIKILILFSLLIAAVWWIIFAQDYIFAKTPVGGDYFNALTYFSFFAKHLPHPAAGWLHFGMRAPQLLEATPGFCFIWPNP